MLSNEQHLTRIIDDLKGQLSEKALELASTRSIAGYWKDRAEQLENNEENARTPEVSEPKVHVVTTKE